MKLILRSDVDGLGKRGDIVDVADGYGRNYLLPRGLAFAATAGAVDQAAQDAPGPRPARRQRPGSGADRRHDAGAQGDHRHGQGRQEGRLFGSITTADVVDAVRDQTGIELERRQLDSEPIKTIGQHIVTAKLHSDVSFPITVDVVTASTS